MDSSKKKQHQQHFKFLPLPLSLFNANSCIFWIFWLGFGLSVKVFCLQKRREQDIEPEFEFSRPTRGPKMVYRGTVRNISRATMQSI